jgi:hypothetical protein
MAWPAALRTCLLMATMFMLGNFSGRYTAYDPDKHLRMTTLPRELDEDTRKSTTGVSDDTVKDKMKFTVR